MSDSCLNCHISFFFFPYSILFLYYIFHIFFCLHPNQTRKPLEEDDSVQPVDWASEIRAPDKCVPQDRGLEPEHPLHRRDWAGHSQRKAQPLTCVFFFRPWSSPESAGLMRLEKKAKEITFVWHPLVFCFLVLNDVIKPEWRLRWALISRCTWCLATKNEVFR